MASPYSFTTRMPSGFPGTLSRLGVGETIEAQVQSATGYLTAFGLPVVISSVDSGMRGVTAGDTGDVIYGFGVRPFPAQDASASPAVGVSTPAVTGIIDIMKRGYMSVLLGGATAATKGGKVYARISNASSGKVVGDIEAANDIGVTAAATVGTGTQTAGTLSATDATPVGVYNVIMTSTTKFDVLDAAGAELLHAGSFATQYTLDNGLSFRMTTGGSPTLADVTAITVVDNTVLIPRCYFMGAADSSGNVEIGFHI